MDDKAKYEALAKLRIGMPQEAVERILGADNMPQREADKGRCQLSVYEEGALGPTYPFMGRITSNGRIGELSYFGSFPDNVEIGELSIGMPREDALWRWPDFEISKEHSSEKYGFEGLQVSVGADVRMILVFKSDKLFSIRFELLGATYPGALPPEAESVRAGLKAYDMEMLHRFVDKANNQGWVFGLPPGIKTEQWPLDPISGYPLMHGFTLLLPEDYRVHGPNIVALSFFATASDQNDGGADKRDDLYDAVVGNPVAGSESPALKPFRDHAVSAHPRLHRMRDILDYEYAVILLTEAEFKGAPCQPPVFAANSFLNENNRPKWMSEGGGHACFWSAGGYDMDDKPSSSSYIYKILGEVPRKSLDWHRAIHWTPRLNDPNAGIPPSEVYGEPSSLGYQSPYDPENNYEPKPWAKDHKSDHIGGTMRPTQGTPEFSPFYIEFEEHFGGYNFGAGGNAQLDILLMRFDWACG